MGAVEQNVQQASGQKVRSLAITRLQSDGSPQTVQMQVVAIADETGHPLSFETSNDLLNAILTKLEEIRFQMELNN